MSSTHILVGNMTLTIHFTGENVVVLLSLFKLRAQAGITFSLYGLNI